MSGSSSTSSFSRAQLGGGLGMGRGRKRNTAGMADLDQAFDNVTAWVESAVKDNESTPLPAYMDPMYYNEGSPDRAVFNNRPVDQMSLSSGSSDGSVDTIQLAPLRPATLSDWPPIRHWSQVPQAFKQKVVPTNGLSSPHAAPDTSTAAASTSAQQPRQASSRPASAVDAIVEDDQQQPQAPAGAADPGPSSDFNWDNFVQSDSSEGEDDGFSRKQPLGDVQPADSCTSESLAPEEQRRREELADKKDELLLRAMRVQKEVQRRVDLGENRDDIDDWEIKKQMGFAIDVVKNFYEQDPDVAQYPQEMVNEMRSEHNNDCGEICVKDHSRHPRTLPKPIMSFEHIWAKYPEIMNSITESGFSLPMPIQREMWPLLMSGLDVIGIAQTGSGKTLAFLLPAFVHIDRQPIPRRDRLGPTCIIITPTRELAGQICDECDKYPYKRIKYVNLTGGNVSTNDDRKRLLARQPEIVVGTPGKINDMIRENALCLDYITYLVLDEADRMLDANFYQQIMGVLQGTNPNRITVLTSATWPEKGLVREIAAKHLTDPVFIQTGQIRLSVNPNIELKILVVRNTERWPSLMNLLTELDDQAKKEDPRPKVLIFFNTKDGVGHMYESLTAQYGSASVAQMSSNLHQIQRNKELDRFTKVNKVWIMVATDVVGRGIDLDDISHVVNYDLPKDIDQFVHRVGRTGRAGRKGVSLSFVNPDDACDQAMAPQLVSVLEQAKQAVPDGLRRLAEHAAHGSQQRANKQQYRHNTYGGGGSNYRRNNDRQQYWDDDGYAGGGFGSNAPPSGGFSMTDY